MVHFGVIFRILGMLLMLFSLSYLVPIAVSLAYQDGEVATFVYSLLITLTLGAVIWLPYSRNSHEMRSRDGFLITVCFWVVLGLVGSIPLHISEVLNLSISDAVFEAISGLTTTGATVVVGLDSLPESILMYRQLLQWMGGIGIIVIAVAILPMLGIGGMQLYRAEAPGPVKDNKLTPRIAQTAKALFLIYVTLTVICAVAYNIAGMSIFDAIAHSFSTVAIGGFSTHDQSIGFFLGKDEYHGVAIAWICIGFMILSGLNFALHYYAFYRRTIRHYTHDSEAKLYFAILGGSAFVVVVALILSGFDVEMSVLHGIFQTVSIATTTGFTSHEFGSWPQHIAFFMLFLSFFGACAGSTGGGIKIGRMLILAKQTLREITRLIHPNAVVPIKVGDRLVNTRIADAIWGFFGAYLMVFYLMVLTLLATGLDYVTAWSAVAATINNMGPGLGEVSANYTSIPDFSKWVLCFSMILGRLELFTLIVLFLPMFWRK